MNIIVIAHTLWTERMAACWRGLDGLEVTEIPAPTADWDSHPELKAKVAGLIRGMAEIKKPAFIVDINGAGILPLDPDGKEWTPQAVGVRWCEWWWDDPLANGDYLTEKYLSPWLGALKSPNVTHFFFDKTLAAEYSVWLGRKCHWLPTAVHPGDFQPSAGKTRQADLVFLGTYYSWAQENLDTETAREVDFLGSQRILSPDKSVFDTVSAPDAPPLFKKVLEAAAASPEGPFNPELRRWRHWVNTDAGAKRRNTWLDAARKSFPSFFFSGAGFAPGPGVSGSAIYNPAALSALYSGAELGLNFRGGQAFSGIPMRCYEIMSCGGVLAMPERPDFDPDGSLEGSVYIRFSDMDNLRDTLMSLRGGQAKSAGIRAAARDFVLSGHTWLNRLSSVFGAL